MSWDFHMEMDLGGESPSSIGQYDANYTYNVSPMFYEAFDLDDGIRELDGMIGSKAEPIIQAAIVKMTKDPDTFEAMNPDNGWGNYEGALELLRTLRIWCREAPKATMRVS